MTTPTNAINKITLSLTSKKDLLANNKRRSTLIEQTTADTLSMAYYGIVQGDISNLDNATVKIVDTLDKTYKSFIPATFDNVGKKWVFNKTKAASLRTKLNVELSVTTFEEFLAAINLVETTNELIKEMAKEKETPEQLQAKEDSKLNKYFVKQIENGNSVEHMISMLTSIRALGGARVATSAEFDKRLAEKLAGKALANGDVEPSF